MRVRFACPLLLALGLVRMGADLAGASSLAGLAAATGAAPAPKVFSAVDGLETYSSRFFVEWTDATGNEHSIELTPELYARLAGPYNRRNVYGAALAYGPVLAASATTRPLQEAILRHAVCDDAPLLRELRIETPNRVGPVRVRIAPERRPSGATWPTTLRAQWRTPGVTGKPGIGPTT